MLKLFSAFRFEPGGRKNAAYAVAITVAFLVWVLSSVFGWPTVEIYATLVVLHRTYTRANVDSKAFQPAPGVATVATGKGVES